MRLLICALAALALSGCASLTAEAPLFPPGDAAYGPAPIEAGVWVGIEEESCTEQQARRRRPPASCETFELRQDADGAWRVPYEQEDADAPGGVERMVLRVVFAPAIENALPEQYAPLYVAEIVQAEGAAANVGYAVIVPDGTMPARAFYVIGDIDCDHIFRNGPIEGVRDLRTPPRDDLSAEERAAWDAQSPRTRSGSAGSCVAETQAGVREAARRVAIEDLPHLQDTKMIWLRSLAD